METVTLINGNKQPYTLGLPKVIIIGGHKYNDVAIAHIKENTGIDFKPNAYGIEAQLTESKQLVSLLMTYNFKTRYYNNVSNKNELHLKSDHHVGYDINSVCLDCLKHNHIHTNGMKEGDRLSC